MSIQLDAWQMGEGGRHVDSDTQDIRRQIVEILREETGTVSERELADRLAASETASKPASSASDAATSLRARLYHLHLPKLDDDGLVDWDRGEREVAATDEVADAVGSERRETVTDLDSTGSAPAETRRREILAIVKSETGSVARDAIARELASATGQPTEARVEELAVQLHHRHLPKLADSGLVDYDIDAATVTYRGPQ